MAVFFISLRTCMFSAPHATSRITPGQPIFNPQSHPLREPSDNEGDGPNRNTPNAMLTRRPYALVDPNSKTG